MTRIRGSVGNGMVSWGFFVVWGKGLERCVGGEGFFLNRRGKKKNSYIYIYIRDG